MSDDKDYQDARQIGKFLGRVRNEVKRARGKFPSNRHQLTALGEEKGELDKALIEHEYGNASAEEVYEEAVQVAAMALRVALEGDHSFDYELPNSIQ